MRDTALCVALIACLAGGARSQSRFPPVPGFNVGLNPRASFAVTTYFGQPAFFMVLPGDQEIATFHDPAWLPPGTQSVQFDLQAWAVLEPNSCAVGAGLYFDTQNALSTLPVALVGQTGWNLYGVPWSFRWVTDPFYSTWLLSYCRPYTCTSPCGPQDRDPDWEVYLMTIKLI